MPDGPFKRERLDYLKRHAALAIGWERLWPGLTAALTLAGLFLALSFLGLWLEAPRWIRIAGVSTFAIAILTAIGRSVRDGLATSAERLTRIDQDSGLPHRPAATLDDQLANPSADKSTLALWQLHQKRAAETMDRLRVAPPSPRNVDRDRFALRGLALVGVAAAAFVAGPEKYSRVFAAFDWRTPGVLSQGFRVDAWIDPPAYTRRPPIVLKLKEDGTAQKDVASGGPLRAPSGSIIIVRASSMASLTVEHDTGIEATESEVAAKTAAGEKPLGAEGELRFVLRRDAHLDIQRYGSTIARFDIVSIPDHAPTIALKDEPKNNARGSLTLSYKIDDDYGVVSAEARFANPIINAKPVVGRSLVDPPRMQLGLPSGTGGLGDAETTADLSEHPWAGARVTMTLHARDEGDNEGASVPVEMILPQRPFVNPLAKALVEQRRNLVLAPDAKNRVQSSMDALLLAPDQFGVTPGIFLGLTTIARRLSQSRTDVELVEVADLFWEMALRLEGGDLSEAERDLRAAQQQLRDAMQRGASDEEIRKLMEQLRAAMDKFLNELAQQAPRDNEQTSRNDNSRNITPQDLKSLLDRMAEMMKNGSMAEAQQMLDQLQRMLENLQTARRPNNGGDRKSREMNRALDELDQMTRDEQQLRDETYQQGQSPKGRQNNRDRQQQSQRQRGQNQQRGENQQRDPQSGEESDDEESGDTAQKGEENRDGQQGQEAMRQRQQALRQRLEVLKNRMKQNGMKGEQGLEDAEDAMKEAEGELGKGENGRGKAVDAEGRAVEGLRKGAQSLAQQMQQGDQPGEGGQAGPGNPPGGQPRDGRPSANPDPLGREAHDRRDNNQQVYDPLGVPAAQRAQRVLEELRKRLGETFRPRDELDYLERLLRRY